jgi:hypothetical protein
MLPSSFAHLAAGEDKVIGEYKVDMGYDPEFISAGESFTLSFIIMNATTQEQLNPRKVWVRILKDDKVAFAATFAPEARTVMTVMSLPENGVYTIDVRFFGEGPQAIAIVEFPLTVQVKKASGMIMAWALAALGAAILAIIGYVWYKAKTTPYSKKEKAVQVNK